MQIKIKIKGDIPMHKAIAAAVKLGGKVKGKEKIKAKAPKMAGGKMSK